MALTFRQIPDENGQLQWTVESDQPNPNLLYTGKHAAGHVTTSDGTVYDTTDPWLEMQQPQHAGEVNHLIGVQHERADRFGLAPEPVIGTHPVTGQENVLIGAPHECTDACGPFKVARPVHAGHLGLHQDQVAALTSEPEGN